MSFLYDNRAIRLITLDFNHILGIAELSIELSQLTKNKMKFDNTILEGQKCNIAYFIEKNAEMNLLLLLLDVKSWLDEDGTLGEDLKYITDYILQQKTMGCAVIITSSRFVNLPYSSYISQVKETSIRGWGGWHFSMDDKYKLQTHFVSCGCIGDFFYLHNFLDGALMRMDKIMGKMSFLNASVKGVRFGGALDYLYADGCIYMVQQHLRYIMCYDIAADKADYWELPCTFYTPTRPNGSLSVLYEGEIYIFPVFDKYIYVFSLKEKRVVRKIEIDLDVEMTSAPYDEKVEKEYVKPRKALFRKGIRVENDVWLFPETGDEVVRYALDTGEMKKYFLPEHDSAYLDICYYEDKFYMLNGTGQISTWKPDGKMELLWGDKGNPGAYMRVAVTDENIWLLPNRDSDIVVYDCKTGKFTPCPFYPDGFEYKEFVSGQSLFYLGCEDADWYYFCMCAQTHMLWVNKHTGQPHWLKPVPPPMKERLQFKMRHSTIMWEAEAPYTMGTWIEALSALRQVNINEDGLAVGSTIYDYVAGGPDR